MPLYLLLLLLIFPNLKPSLSLIPKFIFFLMKFSEAFFYRMLRFSGLIPNEYNLMEPEHLQDLSVGLPQLIQKAENEMLQGRNQEANRILLVANSIDQTNITVFLKLAQVNMQLGNLDVSFNCYNKIVQIASGAVLEEAWYGLGELYFKQAKYIYAESALKTVLALNPNCEKASLIYMKLGIINKKIGDTYKAITFFRACSNYRDLNEEHLNELTLQLGSCFEIIGNKKIASDLYLEAVKLRNTPKNTACLSWIYIRSGKTDRAISLLQKIIRQSQEGTKEFCDLRFLMALAYNKSKKYADSSNILCDIVRLYPNEPYYLAALGILEESMGNYSSALHYLWRSMVFMPERHDILFAIGLIYEKMGCLSDACFLYTRIVELFPWHQQAKLRANLCFAENNVVPAIDLLQLDISEFPFHQNLRQILPVINKQANNEKKKINKSAMDLENIKLPMKRSKD